MRWAPGTRELAWLVERPVAHRGLHDSARGIIENSASAVEAAIAAGYAIEVDIRQAGDGEAVVFHDATLDRLTDQTGPLQARTATELARIRLRGSSDRIRSLAELLEQVNGRATLILELKSRWDGCGPLEERIAQVAACYRGLLALMSFDPDSVRAVKTYAPHATCGFVAMTDGRVTDGEYLPLARRIDVSRLAVLDEITPHFIAHDVASLPSPLSRLYKALGRPVLTWTVRTEESARKAMRFADQIIFERLRP